MKTGRRSGSTITRRHFLRDFGKGAAGLSVFSAPAIVIADRPAIELGVQAGDVTQDSVVFWARSDRAARMQVEIAATESFRNARRIRGPAALPGSDFTAKLLVTDLPSGQDLLYRVSFQNLDSDKAWSEPVLGRVKTAPTDCRDVHFVWSGDTAGQGWGIDRDRGGMMGYEAMRRVTPDFFIHSGDTIYADGPIPAEIELDDGSVWKNVTSPTTSKVAESLDEFRGNYRYNLGDEHLRRFNAEIAQFAQWDDHETLNNWYPSEILDDERYREKSVALLAARANRAFRDYFPIREHPSEPERIYRHLSYGPLLDVFFLDMRSYRGPNGPNREPQPNESTALLGDVQVHWLKQALSSSTGTWKIFAADMPIGLMVPDGGAAFENGANGPGKPMGREHEIADLLRFLKSNQIRNTLWLTADVHYTAAHHYSPERAEFQEFEPFWEFVSGPIHAGTFGPNALDPTFGPKVVFQEHAEDKPNRPPSDGYQFFGEVTIDGESSELTVQLKNIAGEALHTETLDPKF